MLSLAGLQLGLQVALVCLQVGILLLQLVAFFLRQIVELLQLSFLLRLLILECAKLELQLSNIRLLTCNYNLSGHRLRSILEAVHHRLVQLLLLLHPHLEVFVSQL